jgi:hypothetical protein
MAPNTWHLTPASRTQRSTAWPPPVDNTLKTAGELVDNERQIYTLEHTTNAAINEGDSCDS